MLTRWHKTFHILVLGSLAVLALAVFAIKREFRVEQKMAGDEMPEGAAQGGVTPEETFAMFLEALKAGDTELASRYFVITRRQSWQESLRQIKAGGGLAAMHSELSKIPAVWEKKSANSNEASYVYRAQDITFIKNSATHKWEIRDL